MQVVGASAVVRVEMMALTESQLVCKVTRVIYGRVPGDVLHIEGLPGAGHARAHLQRKDRDRKLTGAQIKAEILRMSGFEIGRKAIVFLDQGWKPNEPLVCGYRGMICDGPQANLLEKMEKKIVETVGSGSYLSPTITPGGLGPYLRACESVVRARLTKIGKRSALWKVEAVLHVGSPSKGNVGRIMWYGKGETARDPQPPPATIAVALDTWRLRAESITNYRALQQGKSSATPQEVKKEYDRLVGSELQVGAEAILLIKFQEDAGEQSTFKLIGILHDDPGNGKPIDQTDAKIRQEIKKGDWRAIYL
jgi:hypothetical protein